MVRPVPMLVLIASAACSRAPPVAPPPETRAERLQMLNRIAAECRVARSAFVLVGAEELRVNLGGEERFEKVECVLQRVDGLNLPPGRVRFIVDGGNAARAANETAPVTNQADTAEGNNAQAD